MVKQYGMSEKVGLRVHGDKEQSRNSGSGYSASTNEIIDSEVKRLMQVCFYHAERKKKRE